MLCSAGFLLSCTVQDSGPWNDSQLRWVLLPPTPYFLPRDSLRHIPQRLVSKVILISTKLRIKIKHHKAKAHVSPSVVAGFIQGVLVVAMGEV